MGDLPGSFDINNAIGMQNFSDLLKSNASFVNPRPSSGKPLTPEKLRREENAFRQLLDNLEQYDDILTVEGEDAQEMLNDWQRVGISLEESVGRLTRTFHSSASAPMTQSYDYRLCWQ